MMVILDQARPVGVQSVIHELRQVTCAVVPVENSVVDFWGWMASSDRIGIVIGVAGTFHWASLPGVFPLLEGLDASFHEDD